MCFSLNIDCTLPSRMFLVAQHARTRGREKGPVVRGPSVRRQRTSLFGAAAAAVTTMLLAPPPARRGRRAGRTRRTDGRSRRTLHPSILSFVSGFTWAEQTHLHLILLHRQFLDDLGVLLRSNFGVITRSNFKMERVCECWQCCIYARVRI